MARSGWSTSNYLSYGSGLITATPLSIACWGYTSVTSAIQTLVDLHNNASASNRNSFVLGVNETTNAVQAVAASGAGSSQAASSAGVSASTWFHACGVWASDTSRAAYLNGGNKGTSSLSRTPSGINRTGIGVKIASSLADPFAPSGTGYIAEVGIWNIDLTDAEVAVLATGISPLLVRPGNLVAYFPVIGRNSPEINPVDRAVEMTVTGTLTAVAHPRVIRPSRAGARARFISALTNKTITAAAGSYTLTGTAATPKHGWKVAAAAGSMALSGTAATLRHAWKLAADAGSHALTGTDASPEHGWEVVAGEGAYALSGTDADLIAAAPGEFTIAANGGAYALTGTAASLLHAWKAVAGEGLYSLSGTDAALKHAWKIAAAGESYALAGTDATARRGLEIEAGEGAYALTGATASLLHGWEVAASGGSYALSGLDVELVLEEAAGTGPIRLTGAISIGARMGAAVAASSQMRGRISAGARMTQSADTDTD